MEVPHANEGLVSDFRDCITSDYVSEPGQSLPELASELAYAKEAQFTELHSKEEIVRRLTEELQHGKQLFLEMQLINTSIFRKATTRCGSTPDRFHCKSHLPRQGRGRDARS